MRVCHLEQRRFQALHFVAKHHANRKSGRPIEQVHRAKAGLDRGQLIPGFPQLTRDGESVRGVLPFNALFGAERGLSERAFRGPPGDSAEIECPGARGVRCPEERSDIVKAPDIVQEDAHRQALNLGIRLGGG